MTPNSEVAAIVEAYVTRHLSYLAVAQEFGTSYSRVQSIIRKHAPGSIRPRGNPQGKKAANEGLTLSSLDLHPANPCVDCGTPLVSNTYEIKQACGFCAIAPGGSWMFQRRI